MDPQRSLGRGAAALLAPLGVIAAHVVAFRTVAGSGHDHGDLLAATGHGPSWWIVAIFVTLAAYGAIARIGPVAVLSSRGRTFARTAGLLALVQVLAFVSLETFERASSGGGVAALLGEPAVALGVLIQLATAVAAALIVVLLVRVVSWLAARSALPFTRNVPLLLRPLAATPLSIAVARRPAAPRAPPHLL